MKKVTLSSLLVFFFLIGFTQKKDVNVPFGPNTPIPVFSMMNVVDSVPFTNSNINKKKKTIFIYFGADCGHCTFFTKKMLDSIDLIKNTQIIMVSSSEFSHVRKFYDENFLAKYPMISVGFDPTYYFITYYSVNQFPTAYVYNKNGKFVKSFASEICIKELADTN